MRYPWYALLHALCCHKGLAFICVFIRKIKIFPSFQSIISYVEIFEECLHRVNAFCIKNNYREFVMEANIVNLLEEFPIFCGILNYYR